MEEEVSINNPSLEYLSIYDKTTGERITSYVTKVHGETLEDLQTKAEAEYPDAVHVPQLASVYAEALEQDYLYLNGEYQTRPEPTDEEKREAQLTALDSEYASKISEIETEMAKAKAIEDEDYYADLKAEREELVAEYEEKRGEI